MNSSRRWLIIFGIVIAVLVVVTTVLVLSTGGSKVALLPEDTPQGIVQRYLLAVQNKDFQQAYGYLSFDQSGQFTTYTEWIQMMPVPQASNQSAWRATLGNTALNGNNATVDVIIDVFHPGGLFGGSQFSQNMTYVLTKTADKWLITSPTYLYWIY